MIIFPDGQQFLTTGELARMTGKSAQWVLSAVKRGKLPAIVVGRNYYIKPEDAQVWIEQRGYVTNNQSINQ